MPEVSRIDVSDYIKKNSLIYAVGRDYNKQLLKSVPSYRIEGFDDIVIIVGCDMTELRSKKGGRGISPVDNNTLEKLNISEEELFRVAKRNTEMRYPIFVNSIPETLKRIMGDGVPMALIEEMEMYDTEIQIFTTRTGELGASVIAYDGFKQLVAETMKQDCYIIPSSLHEIMAVPLTQKDDEEYAFLSLLNYVNETEVLPWDRLSDSIYRFDINTMEIRTIAFDTLRNIPFEDYGPENMAEEFEMC